MRPVVIDVTGDYLADDLNAASMVSDATSSPWFQATPELEYFEIATAYCGEVEHSFRLTSNARAVENLNGHSPADSGTPYARS